MRLVVPELGLPSWSGRYAGIREVRRGETMLVWARLNVYSD
jgi:hypothetical protein